MTSRRYLYTSWVEPKCDEMYLKYHIFGKEICPKTGKVHWQGYVKFKNPTRMVTAKKYFHDEKLHLEVPKGTEEQCILYCKKDKEYVEQISGESVLPLQRNPCVTCDSMGIRAECRNVQHHRIQCPIYAMRNWSLTPCVFPGCAQTEKEHNETFLKFKRIMGL